MRACPPIIALLLLAALLPACNLPLLPSSPTAAAAVTIIVTTPTITAAPAQASPAITATRTSLPASPAPSPQPSPPPADPTVGAPASPSPAPPLQPFPAGQALAYRDIQYVARPGSDPRLTRLDLYTPAEAQNAPVLIYIHGGSWSTGDKGGSIQPKMEVITGAGFIFMTINHRLSPAVTHPAHVEDLAAAVAWTVANAAAYGGDPGRIVLMGHSSGAHLAALLAIDPAYLQAAGIDPAVIRGVIGLDGLTYDLARAVGERSGESGERLEAIFGSDPAGWQAASPLAKAEAAAGGPPFLLIYAGERRATLEQNQAFAAALQAGGISVALYNAREKGHNELNQDIGLPGDAATAFVLGFLADLP
jgi:acetyl esterase/lipase